MPTTTNQQSLGFCTTMKKKRASLLPESSNLSPRPDHIKSLQGRRNEELQGSIRSKERLGLLFGALSAFGTLDLPTWSINCSADVPYASGIKPLEEDRYLTCTIPLGIGKYFQLEGSSN
ncbi:unnamed protein product [Musa hybrid cultivar]